LQQTPKVAKGASPLGRPFSRVVLDTCQTRGAGLLRFVCSTALLCLPGGEFFAAMRAEFEEMLESELGKGPRRQVAARNCPQERTDEVNVGHGILGAQSTYPHRLREPGIS
jgi:hypothetical protein